MNTFDFIVIFAAVYRGQARRKLGLRQRDLDHAVRLQNGDDVTEVDRGSLEPGGQLVLTEGRGARRP